MEMMHKRKWLPNCSGEKIVAFGLTEPEAGSDATNSKTTGVLSDDGKHYIVNGQKILFLMEHGQMYLQLH